VSEVRVIQSKYPSLMFAGDLTWAENKPPVVLLAPELKAVSLVPNLEGPLLMNGYAERLRPGATSGLWNGAGMRDFLRANDVELVGGANNHLTDFKEGAQQTVDELGRNAIAIGGVGTTSEEARRATLMSLSDGTPLLVVFFGDRRVGCVPPRRRRAGVNVMSEPASRVLIENLRTAFPRVVIVASVHAGEELQCYPTPYVRRWFRELAMAGADIVVGHHPHLQQGSEKVGESWIFYCLGNFLMGARTYVGIDLRYPPGANSSLGVIVGSSGVRVVRLISDPDTGVVVQGGDPFAPELLASAQFATAMRRCDENYTAWYREGRTVSWWYPLWTGRESAIANVTKTSWLQAVLLARRLVKRLHSLLRHSGAVEQPAVGGESTAGDIADHEDDRS
jgi:hypothetical protein